jgi:hypothetical protein
MRAPEGRHQELRRLRYVLEEGAFIAVEGFSPRSMIEGRLSRKLTTEPPLLYKLTIGNALPLPDNRKDIRSYC